MTEGKTYQSDGLRLLQAVSDWQRGGDAQQNRRRGLVLKEACASLPESHRISPLARFGQVGLEKGSDWDLIGEDYLAEKVSSWTFDIEVAKAFKSGVPPNLQGYQGVIFCINPPLSSRVIVNLRDCTRALRSASRCRETCRSSLTFRTEPDATGITRAKLCWRSMRSARKTVVSNTHENTAVQTRIDE